MKKLLALLLVAALCLSLAACGGTSQTTGNSGNSAGVKPGAAADPAAGHPAFRQTNDPNVTQMLDGGNGNLTILTQDSNGAILREEVYGPDGTPIWMREFPAEGGEISCEYHANGVIARDRKVMPDGSETESTFNEEGQPLIARVSQANGARQTTENQYHANGAISMLRVTTDDMTTTEIFDEVGIRKERLEETNTIDRKLYNAAGVVTYHMHIDEVGNPMEEWFSDSGVVKERKYQDDAGQHEETYYENGVMAEHTIRNGGSEASDETIYQYDSAGNCTLHQSIRINSDGFRTETTYNPDGSRYAYEYHTDGTVWYCEFTAEGVQLPDTLKQIK